MNLDNKKIYNNYRFLTEQKKPKFIFIDPSKIVLEEMDFNAFDWSSPLGQALYGIRLPEEKLRTAHDNVIRGIYTLSDKFPTVVDMLNHLRKVATYSVKTAAVDENYNLYYNPTFMYCLPSYFRVSILAHEAFHYLNNTFKRANWAATRLKIKVDHNTWNIATDLTMNYELVRQKFKFPKGFWVPNIDGTFKLDKSYGGGELDIKKLTSEEVYNIIFPKIEKLRKEHEKGDKQGGQKKDDYIPQVGDIVADKKTNTKRRVISVDTKNKTIETEVYEE